MSVFKKIYIFDDMELLLEKQQKHEHKMSIQDPQHTIAIHRHLNWIVVYLKFIVKFQILTAWKFRHVLAIYVIRMKTE